MIVLDYLKKVKNNSEIIVPPFHTGHLGLIPGTQIRLGVIAPYSNEPSHCEIIVSPYEPTKDLAILRCTMNDSIGVVKKLIDALSYLKINIITEESSSINHQSHHTINLLLDLSRSGITDDVTYEWSKEKFKEYEYVFPINNYKYLKIFETIIAFCGNDVLWKEQQGKRCLQLYINPIEKKELHNMGTCIVKKANRQNGVKIDLPDEILSEIRAILSPANSDECDLQYILLSDTKERNLRIYFPKLESLNRIVHVGFYHNDRPGALSTIFELVARANFNIVAGLLRKRTTKTSIWEGVLEYKGDINISNIPAENDLYEWVAKQIKNTHSISYNTTPYNIKIGNPLYPKTNNVKIDLQINEQSKRGLSDTFNFTNKIESLISLLEHKIDTPDLESLKNLANTILERNKSDNRKRVFLSYPYTASKHAEIIRNEFAEDYFLDEYQIADGNIILDEVLNKIKSCDYFLGIWHHELSSPSTSGKFGISPWMPFELGIALSEGKKFLVVRSDKLDKRIWKRITPEKAIPEYSDLNFKDDTLKIIRSFFKKHFR